jgi:hypothetical protein
MERDYKVVFTGTDIRSAEQNALAKSDGKLFLFVFDSSSETDLSYCEESLNDEKISVWINKQCTAALLDVSSEEGLTSFKKLDPRKAERYLAKALLPHFRLLDVNTGASSGMYGSFKGEEGVKRLESGWKRMQALTTSGGDPRSLLPEDQGEQTEFEDALKKLPSSSDQPVTIALRTEQ